MAKNKSQQTFDFVRMIKKFFLSGFVVFSFIAYAIQQRFTKPDSPISLAPTIIGIATEQIFSSANVGSALPTQLPTQPTIPTAQPTVAILPTSTIPPAPQISSGLYKDGTYTGPTVDAYYGLVKVQATVQNGKITDVQFLQYPSDRRTSVEINNQAMPWLQQEALQVQSAHVNIISGATFTSEGFAMSLDAALKTAKN